MSVKSYKKYLVIMAGMGGLLYGIDIGFIAAAYPYIEFSGNYTTEQLGLIVGLVLWGTVFSSLFAGQLSEWLGRKKLIILSALLFSLSIPICCISGFFPGGNFILIATGRLLQGVAGGLIGVVVPMYLAECLSADERGKGTAMFQLILTFGLVFAALVGLVVTHVVGPAHAPDAGQSIPPATLSSWTGAWQTMFLSAIIPGIILFFGAFKLKESPRWLYKMNRHDEALKSLEANNQKAEAKKIYDQMVKIEKEELAIKKSNKEVAKKESIFKKKYILPFLLTCIVLVLTQATGMNSVLNYSVAIFRETGMEGEFANWSDLAIKVVNFVVTLIAVYLVDRKGRRFLLKIGVGGIVIGELGIATMFFLMTSSIIETTYTTGIISTIFFFVFVAGFAFGPGVCVWLVLSELMPTRIRANGMAIAMILNQAVSASIASVFPLWVQNTGMEWVFIVLAAFSCIYFLVVCLFVPETKGKTLEEISKFFK